MLHKVLLLCVLLLFGCNSVRNEQYKDLSELRERIMEDNINGLSGPAQRDMWLEFSGKALAFYRSYPKDSSAPSLVFNAAELYFKANQGDSALMAWYRDWEDRKSTRLNSSHSRASRMPSSA